MAARRARASSQASSDVEALARVRARQRRRLPRAGLRGPRRAALGSLRARHHRRHHARHDGRPHRPGRRSRASRSRSPTCSTRCKTTPASISTELRVDGGAAANDCLLQFQADLLGVAVVRPEVTETTALGAAYLAGLAVGFWDSTDALARHWRVDRRFEPSHAAVAGGGAARGVARGAEPLEGLGSRESG